ncbi:MAG TPA: DUF3536 domain-containing protein [Vulgatibacter sp.]
MAGTRYICIHGHFYQPPRENPWIEEIELQDTAAPFHDWNARVASECYGPNGAARILGPERRVAGVANNYCGISFNFGPTLHSWLERERPETHRAILEADRESSRDHEGHGNAIAQAYNHMILPLANERDRATQVAWGIADFVHRFGRQPEGMWLPETAADLASLEALAKAGIRFTILSPYQAKAIRPLGSDRWEDAEGGRVDPSRPYLVRLPGGGSIAVFFYDGPIARSLAFGDGLKSAEALVQRLRSGFDDARPHDELLSVAVDGETFGHHRKGGDQVLAEALPLARAAGLVPTNFGQYLARHPPRWEATIVERSSWSCAHGVERWRSDCGCSSRPGWHQRWRGPLRAALDGLRDRIAAQYEQVGVTLFADPWAARDGYVELHLRTDPDAANAWLERHERSPGLLAAAGDARIQALRLLEAQRNAMLMYTSCGWFFDDVSNLETIQILRYAARAMQLSREAGGAPLEPDFLAELAKAESNVPEIGNGAQVYERLVRPSVTSLPGIVAHHAIARLFAVDPPAQGRLFCYQFEHLSHRQESAGPATLSLGRVRLESHRTQERLDAAVAVLHFGGTDIRCTVQPYTDAQAYAEVEDELFDGLARFSLSDVVRTLDARFAGPDFGMRHLFLDRRRALAQKLLRETQARRELAYRQIFESNRSLMAFLLEINAPIPPDLLAAAVLTLQGEVRGAVEAVESRALAPADARSRILQAREEALRLGVRLEMELPRRRIEDRISAVAAGLDTRWPLDVAEELIQLVELGDSLGAGLDLARAQDAYWALLGSPVPAAARDVALRLGERLCFDHPTLDARIRTPAIGAEEKERDSGA